MTESQASVALTSTLKPGDAPALQVYQPPAVDNHLPGDSEKSSSVSSLHASSYQRLENAGDYHGSVDSVASVTEGGRIVMNASDALDKSIVRILC